MVNPNQTALEKNLKFPSCILLVFYFLLIIQTWKKCNFSNFGSLFGFWSNQNWKIAENQTRELNNPGSETFLMNLDFL